MAEASKQRLPYGSWPTPITSEVVVAEAVRLSEVQVDGDSLIWSEGRPAEAGRTALVRRGPDGALTELLPEDHNARTAVHEYGGRCLVGARTGSSGTPTGATSGFIAVIRPVAPASR